MPTWQRSILPLEYKFMYKATHPQLFSSSSMCSVTPENIYVEKGPLVILYHFACRITFNSVKFAGVNGTCSKCSHVVETGGEQQASSLT